MTRPSANPSPIRAAPAAFDERSQTAQWHRWWLIAVLAASLGMTAAAGMTWAGAGALFCGALPAVIGMLLASEKQEDARSALVVIWALGVAAACIMAGGVSGPLAPWLLAPVAAATTLGPGRKIAEAAALSLMVVALVAIFQAAGLCPPAPPPALAFWLALTAAVTTSLGLAAGLLMAGRRAAALRIGDRSTVVALERLLSEQPHLLLRLDDAGGVGSAFGQVPHGLSRERLLERGLVECAEPSDRERLCDALKAAREQGAAEAAFSPLGQLHRTSVVTVRRAADGALTASVRDASSDRSREAALEAAKLEAEQLNAGKSRFLANMSHELRTPLNAIMGFSDMMRARLFGPLAGKYGEYAELIHESGGHLLDLINDVLDMSKIEADKYQLSIERFDAREPVSAALRLMRLQADEAQISLRGLLPPAELAVEADPRALKQIVLNLVSNALKFTPKGGSVTVSLTAHEDRLELAVTDTGLGISPDDLQRLGRPYEQAGDADQRSRGSGLGLSLVRAFAELHGGEMAVESELGEGTSVTVRLPVLATPAPLKTAQVIAFTPQR